jgi:uncharacterized SAM-binding protein YcdF (DUF218 family)
MFRRLLKWSLVLSATFVILGAAVYVFRESLLIALAEAWIVNAPIQKADAIVVLGGGMDTRPAVAARLYREGWAPRILVLQPEPSPAQERGIIPTEGDLTRRLLETDKVPANAIELLKTKVNSTFEESRVIAEWVRQHRARCLLVPTDAFHTRRAGWIIRRQLRPESVNVLTIAAPPRRYAVTNWWHSDYGVLDFQNEVLKSAYYWWNY